MLILNDFLVLNNWNKTTTKDTKLCPKPKPELQAQSDFIWVSPKTAA